MTCHSAVEELFFARAKKRGPKRRFSTAGWLVNTPLPQRFPYQRHSGSTLPPGFFDETQLRCSWGRGSRLTAPARSPGRSSASPVSGSPLSRRKTTCSPASQPSPGQAPCGARPSGGAKQCFACFRRTHARRPCGVLSVGSVAAEGDPEVRSQGRSQGRGKRRGKGRGKDKGKGKGKGRINGNGCNDRSPHGAGSRGLRDARKA